jgi:hypothetical protein
MIKNIRLLLGATLFLLGTPAPALALSFEEDVRPRLVTYLSQENASESMAIARRFLEYFEKGTAPGPDVYTKRQAGLLLSFSHCGKKACEAFTSFPAFYTFEDKRAVFTGVRLPDGQGPSEDMKRYVQAFPTGKGYLNEFWFEFAENFKPQASMWGPVSFSRNTMTNASKVNVTFARQVGGWLLAVGVDQNFTESASADIHLYIFRESLGADSTHPIFTSKGR